MDPSHIIMGRDGPPAPAADSGQGQAAGWTPAMENHALSVYLLVILAGISGTFIIWRITTALIQYVRTVTCLTNDTQRYFAKPSTKFSWIKKNMLYAPLFSKRHNREFQLSSAVNVGTLPTRFQFVFLLAYLATNVAFCVVNIPFMNDYVSAARQLRNRTGYLATVNMIPLFLLAGRNNPLLGLLGISFDTCNLIHRWLGRIVALEALAHTVAYWAGSAYDKGWAAAFQKSYTVPFMFWGFIGTIAFVAISIQAASIARHAYYEMFKLLHIALAIVAIMGCWYHFKLDELEAIKWLYPVIVLWGADRFLRLGRIVYHNIGRGGTKTLVEALPGNCVRVTVTMARPWTFRPGQHAYLYMPTISFWQSHPFSLAWSEEAEDLTGEKLAMNRQDVLSMRKTSMSFVIRARTGMTNTLYQRAAASPEGRLITTCFVEGPYGGEHRLHS
jgi:hypothetical protein